MTKSESNGEVGTRIPGSRAELGTRIAQVAVELGGNQAAASIAGVSTKTISEWRGGAAKIPLEAAAKLCVAAGYSIGWLATGEGAMRAGDAGPVDEELLIDVLAAIEQVVAERGAALAPEKKALIVKELYMMMVEEGDTEATSREDLVRRMVRLAS